MLAHEKINYVEFAAVDLAATKAFFQQAFQWQFQDYGDDYTSFSESGLLGGFYQAPLAAKVEQGSALVVLYSENLEVTLTKVVKFGGKVVKDIFDFPGGKRFHFTEPSGNELAVWTLV